jgi:hypothetical protein
VIEPYPLPAVQEWYRAYSDHLAASYRASAPIKQTTTKGTAREAQVIDALAALLPTEYALERQVVIVDGQGTQSPSFDAVFVDRTNWPLLLSEGDVKAVMIESAVTALEVKSTLDGKELAKIVDKTGKLHRMRIGFPSAPRVSVPVTAFAYGAENLGLMYFDFAAAAAAVPAAAPREICILNAGLLTHVQVYTERLVPHPHADRQTMPVLLRSGADSLLLYVYLLCRWTGDSERVARSDLFRLYAEPLFNGIQSFHFERDFVERIAQDADACARARIHFTRARDEELRELYAAARTALGLGAS